MMGFGLIVPLLLIGVIAYALTGDRSLPKRGRLKTAKLR